MLIRRIKVLLPGPPQGIHKTQIILKSKKENKPYEEKNLAFCSSQLCITDLYLVLSTDPCQVLSTALCQVLSTALCQVFSTALWQVLSTSLLGSLYCSLLSPLYCFAFKKSSYVHSFPCSFNTILFYIKCIDQYLIELANFLYSAYCFYHKVVKNLHVLKFCADF